MFHTLWKGLTPTFDRCQPPQAFSTNPYPEHNPPFSLPTLHDSVGLQGFFASLMWFYITHSAGGRTMHFVAVTAEPHALIRLHIFSLRILGFLCAFSLFSQILMSIQSRPVRGFTCLHIHKINPLHPLCLSSVFPLTARRAPHHYDSQSTYAFTDDASYIYDHRHYPPIPD